MARLAGKNVLFVIAHEMFRDEEYNVPREVLEQEGAEITVASTDLSAAKSKLGIEVLPDILLKDVSIENHDAVIFIGGPGCKDYWNDEMAHSVARAFLKSGKLTAAICSAPVIFSKAGILDNRKATCYPDDSGELEKGGAEYMADNVVLDGNIITAKDYLASSDFAVAILNQLQ